jgi:hypothetical protein
MTIARRPKDCRLGCICPTFRQTTLAPLPYALDFGRLNLARFLTGIPKIVWRGESI